MADILAQGNELKQSSSIDNMLINRGETKQLYGNQSAARAVQGRDYYSGLDKIVTEANDSINTHRIMMLN